MHLGIYFRYLTYFLLFFHQIILIIMEPFIGQIMLFAGNFAPKGWALCNGQLLSIAQNSALFSILGTTYGGNGVQTFGLPDLRGRAAMHFGQGPGLTPRQQGELSGSENVTLISTEIPQHNHMIYASAGGANSTANANSILANATDENGDLINGYSNSPANTTLSPQSIGITGGSQPHNNMQPYLVLNYCIALQGIYPSRP